MLTTKSYQYTLPSMKKTVLRVKRPTVRFVRSLYRPEECTDEEVTSYEAMLIGDGKPKNDDTPLRGNGWYNANLYGEKAEEVIPPFTGNFCTGLSTDTGLILDVDEHTEKEVLFHAENYAKFYRLGASLTMQTSKSFSKDLYGNRLGNYAIIFGKPITREEQVWHLRNARKLGLIQRANLETIKYGFITERVNAKNEYTPSPKIVKFFSNNHGDMRQILLYVQHWNRYKDFGF